MKKLATLLLAAGLVFSAFQPASAVEVKPYGTFELLFEHGGNITHAMQSSADVEHNTGEQYHEKHFPPIQRMTLGTRFIIDENLSATYEAVLGFHTWGGPAVGTAPNAGGVLGTRSANIATKLAFLDWVVPGTEVKVRMGMQNLADNGYAVGSNTLLKDFGTGVLVNAPINHNVSVTAGWARATSDFRRGNVVTDEHTDDNLDVFLLKLPVQGEGFRLTPWINAALIGKDQTGWSDSLSWKNYTPLYGAATEGLKLTGHPGITITQNNVGEWRGNSTAWAGGLGGELTMFDPFRFAFDANYSTVDADYSALDRSGWMLALSTEYKTAWGVPTLKFWYTSGDDGNVKNGSERPIQIGSFRAGTSILTDDSALAGNMVWSGGFSKSGTWGLSAQWNKASFIEGLFHNLRVTYLQGTNSSKMAQYVEKKDLGKYLTTKDSVVEVSLDNVYSIYRNLAAMLEVAYLFENMDDNLWKAADGTKARFSNAWRVDLKFMYTF